MDTKIVEFSMADFFSRIIERYGENIDFEWENFEAWDYDRDVVSKQCYKCDLSLKSIITNINKSTNDKGVSLETKDVILQFDWGWNTDIDKRVMFEIEEVIEKTLTLKSILPNKDEFSLNYIVCSKNDLTDFNNDCQVVSKENKLYAIYHLK